MQFKAKSAFFIIAIIIPYFSLMAQTTQTTTYPLTDGPHIFRLNNRIISCSLVNGVLNQKEYDTGKPFSVSTPGVPDLSVNVSNILPDSYPDSYTNIENWFAISDIHGQFNRMKDILIANKIMNSHFKWTFKNGHLILVGDVFDRGPMVTECLWLLFHLDQQAEKSGGKVHVLLGNHDQMIFRDDLRYVNSRYKDVSKAIKRIRYPDIFSEDTVLGFWLRTKHAVIKINNTLFVHAGLHPWFVKNRLSLSNINNIVRNFLDKKSHIIAFDPEASFIFGRDGLFWSRGYFNADRYDPVSKRELETVLDFYNCQRIVVGHTRFDHVSSHLDGLLYSTAVNTEEDMPAEGLYYMKGNLFAADADGHLSAIPQLP